MVELIHADSELHELSVVTDFSVYDSVAALSSSGCESDWMLELPSEIYRLSPIARGDYIYIPGTEWGGPCRRVRHSTSDGFVRLYGVNWRGLLAGRVICPAAGQTHFVLAGVNAPTALSAMLGGWLPELIAVSPEDAGLSISARIRYRTFAEAAESALDAAGGRLALSFEGGVLTLSAPLLRDLGGDTELSGEYNAELISDLRAAGCNHIIALGQGEMLERQKAELWLLPDGTITDNGALFPADTPQFTALYEYSFAETADDLRAAAKRKLAEYASSGTLEIELYDGVDELELSDRVSVRDTVTGLSGVMTVAQKSINISQSRTAVKHVLI